ncbi:gliding motility-associated ABC transporter substrate-binding protein GldG [Ascidiimonas sp. W6]|uniref:gliding motility-associated ABC transporter substrate-binding protein GldG n=1 Tax=Ascidiimonas meishanensis TaxID=3128903 RepID=UPI0030ED6608
MKAKKNIFIKIAIAFVILIAINVLAGTFSQRFDLTKDKRYTLSDATKSILAKATQPIVIDVLLEGDFPSEFKKLQMETQQLLKELSAVNSNIKYTFLNPVKDSQNSDQVVVELNQLGLTPANITVEEGGKVTQEVIFPWAMAYIDETKPVRIPLLKNKLGADSETRVNNSIQQLEYAFASAIKKLLITDKKKIAIIKGNGELEDIYLANFLGELSGSYHLAPITLDSVAKNPQKTLALLNGYDLAIVAKPTEAFSDSEKYVMDQYTLQGGKSLWLIDQVTAEMDSLYANQGKTIAFPRNLNLNDFFFKYGVRVNPVLLNDMYFTQIVLATGEGNNTQYNPVPWVYYPMVFSPENHPINTNIEALRFQFANTIDTLANGINKTVLLRSSPLSKPIGTPTEINLDIISNPLPKETYNDGLKPLAVLLEGSFTSVFKNRVKPFKLKDTKEEGLPSKMIIIADGDLIKNQIRQGNPLELGYDKWTNNFYGNKEFLLNCVNYLLEDTGLINIRSKKIIIPFLDKEKVSAQKTGWLLVNVALPLVILAIFGSLFHVYRKKTYAV